MPMMADAEAEVAAAAAAAASSTVAQLFMLLYLSLSLCLSVSCVVFCGPGARETVAPILAVGPGLIYTGSNAR